MFTQKSRAVAACHTRFGGAMFDEIFSTVCGQIFAAVYVRIWRNIFCTIYGEIFGGIFSAVYDGIFSAENVGIFGATCDEIFSIVYGGTFGGVNEIFGAVFAGTFIVVGGVMFVASYGDKNIQLAQRTGKYDTVTGERKEVQVCYAQVHMVKVHKYNMLVVHMVVKLEVCSKDMVDGDRKGVRIKSKIVKGGGYLVGSDSGGKLYGGET